MKTTLLWSLAIVNALLLAAFLSNLTGSNHDGAALAQDRGTAVSPAAGGAVRARPGEYIMLPGDVTGGSSAVVYVIDANNRQLGALAYDDTQKQLNVMKPIALDRVFEAAMGTPAAPAPVKGTGTARQCHTASIIGNIDIKS